MDPSEPFDPVMDDLTDWHEDPEWAVWMPMTGRK